MQIPKISSQFAFGARKQKAKVNNPQTCPVTDGYLSRNRYSSFQSAYCSTHPDLTKKAWDLPIYFPQEHWVLNSENLGMDQEEAKDTLPSINLRALNRQEKALEKLFLYREEQDYFDRHFDDKKLEKLRAKAQGYVLKDAVYDYTKAQVQVNQFQKTFSGHELDLNKVFMLDAALNAKRKGKEESNPIKINGKTYFSSLKSAKIQKGEKQEDVDFLVIRCPEDKLVATFKQREFKNDLDFLINPEDYKDYLRPEFSLVELKTGSDVILLNPVNQSLEGVYKNCSFSKTTLNRSEKFIVLRTANNDTKKRGFFVYEDCKFSSNNKLQRYGAKYRYSLQDGCLMAIEKAGLKTKEDEPCHYNYARKEGWKEVLNR